MNLLESEEIIQHNSETEGRHYTTPTGGYYPSVTSIVGILNEKHIKEWVARVGEEKANEIKKIAGEHGSRWHELMEKTLYEGVQKIPFGKEFFAVYPQIINNVFPRIGEVKAIELRMWSDETECAGTVDLIAEFDGKLSIIDWKTSKHEKQSHEIKSYWCQTAAYAIMAEERYGLKIEQLVIVVNQADTESYVYTQPVEYWKRQFRNLRQFYKKIRGE